MQRREFLALGALLAADVLAPNLIRAGEARDVAWLADVTRAPEKLLPTERSLAPLLTNESDSPFRA
jgi:hypothetical protein